MKTNIIFLKAVCLASLCFSGCSPEASQFGQSILSTAGISGSQSSSLFGALQSGVKGLSGLSVEEEYYLGRAVSAKILGINDVVQNPGLQAYVNKVGMTLAGMSERPETYGGYKFAVVNSSQKFAVSGPGGFVFVSAGMLKILKDEDMLAAVLAHEIGHVVLGHGTKAISTSNIRRAALAVGQEAVNQYGRSEISAAATLFSGSVDDLTKTLLESGYSRGQEYDADEFAVALLDKTGYDPSALAEVLEALNKAKSEGGWFSTHPEPEDRLDEVKDLLEDLKNKPSLALRKKRAERATFLR